MAMPRLAYCMRVVQLRVESRLRMEEKLDDEYAKCVEGALTGLVVIVA